MTTQELDVFANYPNLKESYDFAISVLDSKEHKNKEDVFRAFRHLGFVIIYLEKFAYEQRK